MGTVLIGQGKAVLHEPRELNPDKVLQVHLFEARPNKMFSEEHRQAVRFLRFNIPVECAECGRRSKLHWTSLFSFKAMDMKSSFVILRSGTDKVHAPLTPVCSSHPMAAAEMPPLPPRKRKPRGKK